MFKTIVMKAPLPLAGLALAFTGLGSLCGGLSFFICDFIALAILALLLVKLVMFPQLIRTDLKNSILAGSAAAFFMTIVMLTPFFAGISKPLAFGIWATGFLAHVAYLLWFSAHYLKEFKLYELFPTHFLVYAGIMVAAVVAPSSLPHQLGFVLFKFGMLAFAVLSLFLIRRYKKLETPEAAEPLFCIFAAPLSLGLAAYLTSYNLLNEYVIIALLAASQIMLIPVLFKLPKMFRRTFHPAYAAMTFPFVITAKSLKLASEALEANWGVAPEIFTVPLYLETLLAVFLVAYVFALYIKMFKNVANDELV